MSIMFLNARAGSHYETTKVVENLVWFERERVHSWLDKFTRAGTPGVKRRKGQKIAQSVSNQKGEASTK